MTRQSKTILCTALALALLCALPLAQADACELRSHTQEEWGTSSRGDNPASYRTKHFASAFPSGVMIGIPGSGSARFTTSSKVQTFLPATGAAGSLTGDLIDPLNTTGGVLAGETLTLALSVGFDAENESFASATTSLADARVTSGTCAGMTVSALLAEANARLAGIDTTRTAQQLSDCIALVNGNASVLSCDAMNTTTDPINDTSVVTNVSGNNASNVTSNTTGVNMTSTFSLRVASWYPKIKTDGVHYVFFCDATVAPTRYDWRFGDGEKLLNITNNNVYHIFKRAGTFNVTCGNTTDTAAMAVVVA